MSIVDGWLFLMIGQVALKEACRVLKKGGRIMILEFSHLQNPLMAQFYDRFSFDVIPKIGKLVANDEASYQYLVESIRRFPKQVSSYSSHLLHCSTDGPRKPLIIG